MAKCLDDNEAAKNMLIGTNLIDPNLQVKRYEAVAKAIEEQWDESIHEATQAAIRAITNFCLGS